MGINIERLEVILSLLDTELIGSIKEGIFKGKIKLASAWTFSTPKYPTIYNQYKPIYEHIYCKDCITKNAGDKVIYLRLVNRRCLLCMDCARPLHYCLSRKYIQEFKQEVEDICQTEGQLKLLRARKVVKFVRNILERRHYFHPIEFGLFNNLVTQLASNIYPDFPWYMI